MDGCFPSPSPNIPCPVPIDELARASAARLPPGWLWEAATKPDTMMYGIVRAWAGGIADLHVSICNLLPEFVCHSTVHMVPEWWADYGLPDECGINDLCAKVRAIGGATCDYFGGLAEYLGYGETCCRDFPVEIQPGGWALGVAPMPPPPVFTGGGSLLGVAMLSCPPPDCGADLGFGDEGCPVAGYQECVETVATTDACRVVSECEPYIPPAVGELLVGCPAPWRMEDYTGTAYHWWFGVPNDLAALMGVGGDPATCDLPPLGPDWAMGFTALGVFTPGTDPEPGIFPITGCWEMGCTPLCDPSPAPLLCFVNQLKPAHTVAVPIWCEQLPN